MKFRVEDPSKPEWQGCIIEGSGTTDALAKWAAGSKSPQTVRLFELRDLGLFEAVPSIEVRQVPDAVLPVPRSDLIRDAIESGRRCSGLDPSLTGVVFR